MTGALTAVPFDAERASWLAWRRQGIGASDVAALLGISPWASPWSVWADKLALVPDEDASEVMEAGQWLELAIGPWFEARTGLRVVAEQARCEHAVQPVHRCTLDGLNFGDQISDWSTSPGDIHGVRYVGPPGPGPDKVAVRVPVESGLEIKTAGPGRPWAELPAHYQAQGQWQMHVTGLDRVRFAVLMGRRLDTHLVLERDQDDIDFMVAAVDRFWHDHIQSGTPPATDGHDATLRVLGQLYPTHTPGASVAIDDMQHVHADWLTAKADKKAAETREKAGRAELAARLGDAEEGTVAGERVVSWRTQSRTDLDEKALAARYPRAVRRFRKTTEVRVMRAHQPKTRGAR